MVNMNIMLKSSIVDNSQEKIVSRILEFLDMKRISQVSRFLSLFDFKLGNNFLT